jgi:hypothetical protein
MQDALERAFDEASHLPEDEQQWLAAFILDEIASERRWDDLIARSGSVLDRLIAEARAEDDHGFGL